MDKKYTIAVAGIGCAALSMATFLSQHHKVYTMDIVSANVSMIKRCFPPFLTWKIPIVSELEILKTRRHLH